VDVEARQYENIARLYVATAGGWMMPEQHVAAAAVKDATKAP
jgi:hypothetical protein